MTDAPEFIPTANPTDASQVNARAAQVDEAGNPVLYDMSNNTDRTPTYRNSPDAWETLGAIVENDFITSSLVRSMRNMSDPEYNSSTPWDGEDDAEITSLFEEHGTQMNERLVRRVRQSYSRVHASRILDRAAREMENEDTIDRFFQGDDTAAFLTRLGVGILDPVGFGAGAAAEGIVNAGVKATTVGRLAAIRAAQVTETGTNDALRSVLRQPIGRGEYALRQALAASAANGSLEVYHLQDSPNAGQNEYMLAAIGSLALGGAFAALGYRGAQRRIVTESVFEADAAVNAEMEAFFTSRSETTTTPRDPFGGGSVGAARQRAPGDPEVPTGSTTADPLVDEFDPGQNTAQGGPVRWDAYNSFNGSENPYTRAGAAMILEDGAASEAGRGRPQHFTVELLAQQHERVFGQQFAREMEGAYDLHKKANNIRTRDSAMDARHYNEFTRDVARAVRDDPTLRLTPEITRVRDAFRKSMREQLAHAQARGILMDVSPDDLYVPRFWRREAFMEIIEQYGDVDGKDMLANLIGRGLLKTGTDVEVADSIARHVTDVITRSNLSDGEFAKFRNMQRGNARAALIKYLGPDVDEEVLDGITDLLTGKANNNKAPDGPRGESRLRLDENATYMFNGKPMRLDDLLNNDLLAVNTIYSRQIGGRSAFSEVSGGKLKTTADIENFLSAAQRHSEAMGATDPVQEAKYIARMRTYADYLLGHGSLADDGSFSADHQLFMKFLRDASFARLMGQAGYAQLAEVGTAIGALGLKSFLRHAPAAMQRVMNDFKTGMPAHEQNLTNIVANTVGLGDANVQSRMRTMSRELDAESSPGMRDRGVSVGSPKQPSNTPARHGISAFVQRIAEKAGRTAELAARMTSIIGGLQPIDDFSKVTTATALVAQFAENARKGNRLNTHVWGLQQNDARLLGMGIDDQMHDRITAVFAEIADYDEHGILTGLRLDASTDPAAVRHMFRSVLRESRRIIQETDLGTSREALVNPLVRTILQFRSFVMAAHVKQTLYGATMRDAQLGSEFLMSMTFAAMGQMAKYNLMTAGMSQDRRDEYLTYAFGDEGSGRILRVAASAFRYSSHGGMLPDAADTVSQQLLHQRFFDYRNSGLSSGFADPESSASFNTIMAPLQPFAELADGQPDDAVRDLMRIGPNYTPLLILGNVLQEQVPEKF